MASGGQSCCGITASHQVRWAMAALVSDSKHNIATHLGSLGVVAGDTGQCRETGGWRDGHHAQPLEARHCALPRRETKPIIVSSSCCQ